MADDDEDPEDTKFGERFNRFFHKAMGERESRFEKKLMRSIDGMLGNKFDDLRTMLTDSDDTFDVDDLDVDSDPEFVPGTPVRTIGGSSLSPEDRARLRRTEMEARQAKTEAETFKKQYQESEQKRAHAEERQTLITTMQPFVKPRLLDIVVDQIHGKHLHRDTETQQILWRDENGEMLPLKDGAAAWAKSDVGKEFAPPAPSGGRGGRGPDGVNGIAPGKMTAEHLADIVSGSIPGQRH